MTTLDTSLSAPRPNIRRDLIAASMVAISTIAIAMVPSFARLAYDGGSNTLSVITARSILSLVLTLMVMAALRQSLRIGRTPLLISLASGVIYAVMLYGFLGAVAFIPVNTVILIYFIHPVLVGLVVAYLGDEPMSGRMIAALLAAFAGLALAVGPTFASLNMPGIALAVLATLTAAGVIVGNGRAVRQAGGLTVVFYMMLAAAVSLSLLFMAFGSLALPTTALGWSGFAGVAIASTVGTLLFFCAVPMIGTVRATMISNLEPLLGIVFAVLLVGEHISAIQAAGIGLVILAIVSIELRPKMSPRTND